MPGPLVMGALARGGASLIGGIGKNNTDPERRAKVAQALERALAGDVVAAQTLYTWRTTNQPKATKQAASAAWQRLTSARPDIAAQASGRAIAQVPELQAETPTARQALVAELQQLEQKVRSAAAQTVQRIGVGATDAAAQKIDPSSSRESLPLPVSRNALAIGAIAGLLGLAMWLSQRKH